MRSHGAKRKHRRRMRELRAAGVLPRDVPVERTMHGWHRLIRRELGHGPTIHAARLAKLAMQEGL